VLALVPILGTIAQAVLGGITVLTGLSPLIVGAHFLVSMVIVALVTATLAKGDTAGLVATALVLVACGGADDAATTTAPAAETTGGADTTSAPETTAGSTGTITVPDTAARSPSSMVER